MKTLKRLANVLAGLAFVALLAVNVQIGSGGNFFGSALAKASTVSLDPTPPMECPFAADFCGWYRYHPGGPWRPIVGEPITVTAPAPEE